MDKLADYAIHMCKTPKFTHVTLILFTFVYLLILMKEQILSIIKNEGLSASKLAEITGVQPSSVSHILNGRNKPSYDFILKILENFKNINAEWLLTGNGNMYKHEENLFSKNSEADNNVDSKRHIVDNHGDLYNKGNEDVISVNNNKSISSNVTNVNSIEKILILYKDGSFSQYIPRESDI